MTMHSAIATGKNLNYGREGEKIQIGDVYVRHALVKGFIINARKNGCGRLVIRCFETGKELRIK